MPDRDYYLPKRGLVEQNRAAIIERANIPRSKFVGSKTRKTAFDAGDLVPFLVDEILPGDHMTYDVTAYLRMDTPLFPIFDNQSVHTFFFFVPARILWENWERMMGAQDNPADTIAYLVPTINLDITDLLPNTIYDHMGLPVNMAAGASIDPNVLPLRAYNKIWNDWFRDENVNSSTAINTDNGPDDPADYVLKKRNKAHDYFTSCLPWPQKFTAPTVPYSGLAPIQGLGMETPAAAIGAASWYETARGLTNYPAAQSTNLGTPNRIALETDSVTGLPEVYADLSQATGVTINVFRQAFMIQTLLERDARGGTRYTEILRSQFGVVSPDFRLQRSEYIGGGMTSMQITPIAQTAPSAGVTVGALGAAGTATGQHRATYAATEHGYILGLINVRTELSYQQGLHKLWSRSTRYDFYTPALAALGEQAVLQQEIYCTGDGAADGTVFGYQARWDEYRQLYSDITGMLRSDFVGSLDAWHLAQYFDPTAPTLSPAFLRDEPPMERVLAAGALADNQQYKGDILIRRTAIRPLPTFGTPATLGRF